MYVLCTMNFRQIKYFILFYLFSVFNCHSQFFTSPAVIRCYWLYWFFNRQYILLTLTKKRMQKQKCIAPSLFTNTLITDVDLLKTGFAVTIIKTTVWKWRLGKLKYTFILKYLSSDRRDMSMVVTFSYYMNNFHN